MRNKSSLTSLLLAGAAAYAYYKYSKMTPEQRKTFVGNLKQKGRDFVDHYMPSTNNRGQQAAAAEGSEFTA